MARAAMTAAQARECVEKAKRHLEGARKWLLALYEGRGWQALGYASWRACAAAEFGQSQAYLYRLLKAAEVERDVSPVGEIVPERALRPLGPLSTPDRRDAWELATLRAGGDVPTAEAVRESVEALRDEAVAALPREQRLEFLRQQEAQAARRAEARQERDATGGVARRLDNVRHHIKQAVRHAWGLGGDMGRPIVEHLERAEAARLAVEDGARAAA